MGEQAEERARRAEKHAQEAEKAARAANAKARAQTNHYETLGVQPGCSMAEIRKAYLNLSRRAHPDKNDDGLKNATTTWFRGIQAAHDVLKDPEQKQKYDKQNGFEKATSDSAQHAPVPKLGDIVEVWIP